MESMRRSPFSYPTLPPMRQPAKVPSRRLRKQFGIRRSVVVACEKESVPGGTSVPPVNHAQDARATFKLHHSRKSSATSQQKNQNQNTCRHSQQPQNDVTDLAFLIVKVWHDLTPLVRAS